MDGKLIGELEKYDLTAFQKRVLIATASIKKGQVKTYKQIAQQIGRPKAYRAVGTALRLNPLAPRIPCHRVIKSDGSFGKYGGKDNGAKAKMLAKEGYGVKR